MKRNELHQVIGCLFSVGEEALANKLSVAVKGGKNKKRIRVKNKKVLTKIYDEKRDRELAEEDRDAAGKKPKAGEPLEIRETRDRTIADADKHAYGIKGLNKLFGSKPIKEFTPEGGGYSVVYKNAIAILNKLGITIKEGYSFQPDTRNPETKTIDQLEDSFYRKDLSIRATHVMRDAVKVPDGTVINIRYYHTAKRDKIPLIQVIFQ